MRTRSLILTTAVLALAGLPLAAAEHPDITGTWTIDAAKSDFGPMPAPSDLTVTVTASGDDFSVLQKGGGQPDLELRFNTSGKEVANELPNGKMTSVHRWEGAVLVGDITFTLADGTKVTFSDRSTYSADGKSMTTERKISGPMGEGQMKMVLNRK
jgi:hypothetical protein